MYGLRARLTASGLAVLAAAGFATFGAMAHRPALAQGQAAPIPELAQVEQIVGRRALLSNDGVATFTTPRADLQVAVMGVPTRPAFFQTGEVHFVPTANGALVGGELPLREDEVSPVMAMLEDHQFEVTAIHHHAIGDTPPVLFLHFSGQGDPMQLAQELGAAMQFTTMELQPAAIGRAPRGIDAAQIQAIMGEPGYADSGILKFEVPRAETITVNGRPLPQSAGAETEIFFQPTGPGRAAVTGDFCLVDSEVNPVIRALRTNGIDVGPIHNHELGDQPHLTFMHFFANDDALALAHGLRAALDQTNHGPGDVPTVDASPAAPSPRS